MVWLNRKRMAMLVMLLTMAAGLIGGWAQAVQIEGHKVKKNFKIPSDQWSGITTQGVVITAPSPPLAGSRWIGLAEASGKAELTSRGMTVTALACFQIFALAPDHKTAQY